MYNAKIKRTLGKITENGKIVKSAMPLVDTDPGNPDSSVEVWEEDEYRPGAPDDRGSTIYFKLLKAKVSIIAGEPVPEYVKSLVLSAIEKEIEKYRAK